MDDLLARIQDAVTAGLLPGVDCLVTWYGPGQGHVCAVCTHRILGTELAVDCDLPDSTTVRFHARCYRLWQTVLGR
jgi:hypothetical protein